MSTFGDDLWQVDFRPGLRSCELCELALDVLLPDPEDRLDPGELWLVRKVREHGEAQGLHEPIYLRCLVHPGVVDEEDRVVSPPRRRYVHFPGELYEEAAEAQVVYGTLVHAVKQLTPRAGRRDDVDAFACLGHVVCRQLALLRPNVLVADAAVEAGLVNVEEVLVLGLEVADDAGELLHTGSAPGALLAHDSRLAFSE